jgi:uncharacterized protein DUF763
MHLRVHTDIVASRFRPPMAWYNLGMRARTGSRQQPSVVLSALKETPALTMPRRDAVLIADVNPQYLQKILLKTYERAPEDFETLLGMQGVGARTLRALALVSEIIYGTPASTRDPARFSFAHGAKDGFPYPVDTGTYDKTVEVLRAAVNRGGNRPVRARPGPEAPGPVRRGARARADEGVAFVLPSIITMAFGRRCIPADCVAPSSNMLQYSRSSRLVSGAPRRPRCSP